MGAFFPQPEDPILVKARRFYSDAQIKRAQALTSMPLMAALQYCDNHPLPEYDHVYDVPLSKEDKLKTELKKRFSTKSHEAFLNDFKEKSETDNSCNKMLYSIRKENILFLYPAVNGLVQYAVLRIRVILPKGWNQAKRIHGKLNLILLLLLPILKYPNMWMNFGIIYLRI